MGAPRNAPTFEIVTNHDTTPRLAPSTPSARMPAGYAATDDARRMARLTRALAMVWLIFLVYPIIAMVYAHFALAGLLPLVAGGLLFVSTYVWAVVRAAASPYPQLHWAALLLLTTLSLVAPLLYGGAWLGGFIYAAVVAGLTLEMRHAIVTIAGLVGLSIVTGSLSGSSWWQTVAVAALTALSGALMLALRWLMALNRELRASRTEIVRLAASEERLRLSRDLHDAVKQQVFATSLEIGAARALLGRDQQGVEAHLREASAAISQVQAELNAVIHELRLVMPAEQGLSVALRDYTATWSRQSGIATALHLREACECSSAVEQALFRVAQEALANVAKHSGATEIRLTLTCERDTVTLRIEDNGCGFVPNAVSGMGYGLRNMCERVQALGGHVSIESQPGGGGTHITATCLRNPSTAREDDSQDAR